MATGKKGTGSSADQSPYPSERELIMIAAPEADLQASDDGVTSFAAAEVRDLNSVLADHNAVARPLFGVSEMRLRNEASEMAASAVAEVPDLSVMYRIDAPDGELEAMAEELSGVDVVEAAYVKPGAEPADENDINTMTAAPEDAPPATPDFTSRQGYLDPAPGGVDARWAWTRPGGRGANLRTIDIEGAWRFSHEDLLHNQGGVVDGVQSTDLRWRNHGTAVVGEIGADVNSFGVTGIAPDAHQMAISIFGGLGSAGAIRSAANRLRPGDVILIELHRPGPRHNFASREDQAGYIAVEWWEDDFAAIRFAVSRGVIVVEAAGNGAENLDDDLYQTRPSGFPASWTNPFRRHNRDSGAVVVGAGAPPPGTHGRDHGPDRSRLGFSNYGALADAQGWGREVTTTGYGNHQGGSSEDLWYTDTFSGTSSASPIVVGALLSVSGMLRAAGQTPLTPAKARECLRKTGSPQQDAPGRPRTQRIGNRPDIPALYQSASGRAVWSGWNSLGGVLTSNITLGINVDGRMEVFVRGTDGAVWRRWQTAPSNGWSGWQSLGGVVSSDVAVGRNKDGRLEIFARGTDNALWHKWQVTPGGAWSGWNSLGGAITGPPVVGRNADGRLEVFARGTNGAVWHRWQTAPSSGWSGWHSLGGVITSEIAVGTNKDGRMELFVRGTNNAVWHMWQTAPNSGWSGWYSRGGNITSQIALGSNADGRMELFVRGIDNALWHMWQTAPNNGWSGWYSMGGVLTSDPAVGRNKSGRLEVFVRGTDNALWHKWQTAPNNGWSGWASQGGVLTSRIAVSSNSDGRMEVFVRGTDNALWHKWQNTPFLSADETEAEELREPDVAPGAPGEGMPDGAMAEAPAAEQDAESDMPTGAMEGVGAATGDMPMATMADMPG